MTFKITNSKQKAQPFLTFLSCLYYYITEDHLKVKVISLKVRLEDFVVRIIICIVCFKDGQHALESVC